MSLLLAMILGIPNSIFVLNNYVEPEIACLLLIAMLGILKNVFAPSSDANVFAPSGP